MTAQNIWDDLWGSPEEEAPIKPSTYNSVKLARYFRHAITQAPWHRGFAMVNERALAGALAQWKSKTNHDTVLSMMDAYMADETLRGKNPGWQDFLYRAEQIASSLTSTGEKTQKSVWELEEEKWNLEHPDA